MKDIMKDRFRGCFLGGAIGDAWGYPIEFMGYEEIQKKYGKTGLGEFIYSGGKALITDDTQMTLFTAAGLITGIYRMEAKRIGGNAAAYINWAYSDWLGTQENTGVDPVTALFKDARLHHRRAPGLTCLHALRSQICGSKCPPYSNDFGTIEEPVNNSKGCGGVMRVAPLGLMIHSGGCFSDKRAGQLAAEAAAITHGHPLGYLSAALFAEIVHRLAYSKDAKVTLEASIKDSLLAFEKEFKGTPYLQKQIDICQKTIELAHKNDEEDWNVIKEIGGGWVGEEAIAIAIYACVKYPEDFYKAIYCAVNHSGDSDSTGAIAGNILGTYLGFEEMDRQMKQQEDFIFWQTELEMFDLIMQVADQAFGAVFPEWRKESIE